MSKNINGYIFNEDAIHDTSSAHFWQAKKGNSSFFFKRFKDPRRPSDRVSDAVRKQKNTVCDDFARERKKVLTAIRTCVGGNIIAPVEFFEYDRRFYQATEWRQIKAKRLDEISSLPESTKELLLKTATQNLKVVHSKGIIHLDVKPDNLPVSVNEVNGKLVCTLIDFDSSYFENSLPIPELTAATDPYMSPELASYKMKDPRYGNNVSTKNDVFALAIVFHEYWSGRKFIFERSDDKVNGRYLYQAVDNNEVIKMAPGIPDWLEALLRWMIKKNPTDRPTMADVLEALKDHSKIPGLMPIKGVEKVSVVDKVPSFFRKTEPVAPPTRQHRPEPIKNIQDKSSGYVKGVNFPSDAVSFEKLANGNIKIVYRDGSKMVYNQAVALRKGYISK